LIIACYWTINTKFAEVENKINKKKTLTTTRYIRHYREEIC